MLSLVLFGAAIAQPLTPFVSCGLPDDVDPNDLCKTDINKFSTYDADAMGADAKLKLEISSKFKTTDHTGLDHGATSGKLTDKTEEDGRYVLACKQTQDGTKTVGFNITRPAKYTALGAEWVQLFPKDSWYNTTNEYEPFTFNDYGAKVPLQEFRPTDPLSEVAPEKDVLNVFMNIKDEGDYEIKYGNPDMKNSYGNWVAVEFKQTLLRVGTPWASCDTDLNLPNDTYSVGAIVPVLFGHPNLHSVALKAGFPSYDKYIAKLQGTTAEVKIVLEIFNEDIKTYTSSSANGQCYKAGNACPEAHSVCKPEFCEIDVWKQIIEGFRTAGAGTAGTTVSVLGSIGKGTTVQDYTDVFQSSDATYPDAVMDGFYFIGNYTDIEPEMTNYNSGYKVRALNTPLFDKNIVDAVDTYVTLTDEKIGLWNPFSWYPYKPTTRWAAMLTNQADTAAMAKLVDRGYGYVYVTGTDGGGEFDVESSLFDKVIASLEVANFTSGEFSDYKDRRMEDDEGRRLQTSGETFWGCDDTLLECKPICMKQMGMVTSKVSDTLCAAAPMDQCSCQCLHEAQWTCEDDAVVCKARFGAGPLETVGDLVCETRGAPKPASPAVLRIANMCEPMTEMRGDAPAAECLVQWGTPAPEPEATEIETETSTETTQTSTETSTETSPKPIAIMESFAAAMAFAALLIHA